MGIPEPATVQVVDPCGRRVASLADAEFELYERLSP